MKLTRRRLVLLQVLLAVTVALLVASPSNIISVGVCLVLYTIVLVALFSHCEKTGSIRELQGVLLIAVLSMSIGAFIGLLASWTLLSALTATSIILLVLVYSLFLTR
jgi:hypothetical protein